MVFPKSEFEQRMNQTKMSMQQLGIEVLIVTNLANMNYLSGYDGYSYYVEQVIIQQSFH